MHQASARVRPLTIDPFTSALLFTDNCLKDPRVSRRRTGASFRRPPGPSAAGSASLPTSPSPLPLPLPASSTQPQRLGAPRLTLLTLPSPPPPSPPSPPTPTMTSRWLLPTIPPLKRFARQHSPRFSRTNLGCPQTPSRRTTHPRRAGSLSGNSGGQWG